MRKFKLRDKVVKKMQGVEYTDFGKEPSPDEPAENSASAVLPPEEKPAELRFISRTDIGLIRKSNQDAVICGSGLYGVADGMGGHNGGETASAGARDGLIREAANLVPSEENLEAAIQRVNLELWEMQLRDDGLSGMGTTLTVLWPAGPNMLIGHVGDSRAYLLRGGEIAPVTDDHSIVADMVRRGMLTEEQAACHPMRNYITRAVGTEVGIQADILSVPRRPGDRWLVCSDGLHGAVSRERLQELLGAEDLDEAADQMIRDALDQGGRDNITLVIVEDPEGYTPKEENKEESAEGTAAPENSTEPLTAENAEIRPEEAVQ